MCDNPVPLPAPVCGRRSNTSVSMCSCHIRCSVLAGGDTQHVLPLPAQPGRPALQRPQTLSQIRDWRCERFEPDRHITVGAALFPLASAPPSPFSSCLSRSQHAARCCALVTVHRCLQHVCNRQLWCRAPAMPRTDCVAVWRQITARSPTCLTCVQNGGQRGWQRTSRSRCGNTGGTGTATSPSPSPPDQKRSTTW